MNSYIWEEYKQIGKDGKYQTAKISLMHGWIKTQEYNNPVSPKVRLEIVNASSGNRERKTIILGEKEIAQIIWFMNNSKEKELSLIHKFKDNTKSIFVTKYSKNGKAYYIIRIAEGKQNSVSFAFEPFLFRYLMDKIKISIALMSFNMNWGYKKNDYEKTKDTNNEFPDVDFTEDNNGSEFDEEELPDELPDDVEF